jgi:dTDP-4-dehydrorhamnose 3,5-epimerase-like enzyme
MSLIKLIEFEEIGDSRGSLVSLEQMINIPFEIKRIYYIFGTKENVSRGFHAHKNLKQIAICLSGSCTFLIDDGRRKETIKLSNPNVGLYIDGIKWREMHNFTNDCVLLVVASEYFNEEDYIRKYDEFLRMVNEK